MEEYTVRGREREPIAIILSYYKHWNNQGHKELQDTQFSNQLNDAILWKYFLFHLFLFFVIGHSPTNDDK